MGRIIYIKKIAHRVYFSLSEILSGERAVIVLFFLLLFSLLFLGDGKQPIVDIFFSGYVVFFGLSWFFAKKKLTSFPTVIKWLWFVTIVYTFIRTVFSDSVGYSLYTFNRFVLGYLVFHFFYTIASGKTVTFFYQALICFVLSATAVSMFMMVFPAFGRNLPLMNMLYPNYGHNYIAYLLVFIVPIALQKVIDRHSVQAYALLGIVCSAIIFTFARGAWLLIALYIGLVLVFQNTLFGKRHKLLFLGISILLLGLFIGFFNFNRSKIPPVPFTNTALEQFLVKETPIKNRIDYWNQAFSATLERPFFGSGSGTFYLESKRLQKAPFHYSWFAHSFPLQTVVEFGLVGSCLIFLLIYTIVMHIVQKFRTDKSHSKKYAVPLLLGTVLTLGYSMYEFNLDFLVVWLLCWTTLGLLLGYRIEQIDGNIPRLSIMLSAVFVCLFCLFSVSGIIITTVWHSKLYSFLFTPFDTDVASEYISELQMTQNPIPSDHVELINFFHKQNPDILFSLGQLMEKEKKYLEAEQFYKRASYVDPNNAHYYKQYFQFLATVQKTDLLGEEIIQLSQRALPVRFHKQIDEIVPYAHALGEYYTNWMVPEDPVYIHGYAGLFYRFGISDLRDVEPMEKLLTLARDIYPDLAALHVELAAYYYHIKNDWQKAREVLILCQSIRSSSRQCKEQLHLPLPAPTEYKDVIW
jgi:O-antigen ligase